MAFTLATPSGPVMVPTTADWLSQAHVGTTDTPAIFTHEDNKLVLQNGTPSENNRIVLGRHRVEDRSLHPKNVYFQPEEQSLGDVRLEMDNDRGRVLFSNAPAAVIDGKVFALLMDHDKATEFKVVPT